MMMSIVLSGTVRLVLTVVVLIVLFFILFQYRDKRRRERSSLDIMQERLDKGEISEAEYEAAKKKQIP